MQQKPIDKKRGQGRMKNGRAWLWRAGVLLLLTGIGCQKEAPQVPAMAFAVEAERLGETHQLEASGFQFQAPQRWQPLTIQQVDTVTQSLDLAGEAVVFHPQHVFLDSVNSSVLSVATFRLAEAPFEEQMAAYGHLLAERFEADSVRQTLFVKDGITMAQFLVQPEGLVNFKLVFEAAPDHLVQFDYIVPHAEYHQEVKNIESSIGSIQRIP